MTLRSLFFCLGLLFFGALPSTAQEEDLSVSFQHLQLDVGMYFPMSAAGQLLFQDHSIIQYNLGMGFGSSKDQMQFVIGLGFFNYKRDSLSLNRTQLEAGVLVPVQLSARSSLRLRTVATFNAFSEIISSDRNNGFGPGLQTSLGVQHKLANNSSYIFFDVGYDYSINRGDRGQPILLRDWSGFRIRAGIALF